MNKKSKSIKLINWIKENRKSFFSVLVTVLVILALVIFVYARIQVINSAASDKLDMATKIISQGDMKKGLEAIDDVINTYKHDEFLEICKSYKKITINYDIEKYVK